MSPFRPLFHKKFFPLSPGYQEDHKMERISHVLPNPPFIPSLYPSPKPSQALCGFVLPSFTIISFFPHQSTHIVFFPRFSLLKPFWALYQQSGAIFIRNSGKTIPQIFYHFIILSLSINNFITPLLFSQRANSLR